MIALLHTGKPVAAASAATAASDRDTLSRRAIRKINTHEKHAADRREQVDAIGERAERHAREQVGRDRVERVARCVRGAEHLAEELELRRVLGAADVGPQRDEKERAGQQGDGNRPRRTITASTFASSRYAALSASTNR